MISSFDFRSRSRSWPQSQLTFKKELIVKSKSGIRIRLSNTMIMFWRSVFSLIHNHYFVRSFGVDILSCVLRPCVCVCVCVDFRFLVITFSCKCVQMQMKTSNKNPMFGYFNNITKVSHLVWKSSFRSIHLINGL